MRRLVNFRDEGRQVGAAGANMVDARINRRCPIGMPGMLFGFADGARRHALQG